MAAVLVGTAPLAVGAAHQPTVVAFVSACSACLLFLTISRDGRRGANPWAMAAPLAFVALPLSQLLPIPTALLSRFASATVQLVTQGGGVPHFLWLSLDAPSTLLTLAKSVAGLAVFVVAADTASAARRSRNLFVKAVAISGLVGLLIAIVHRIWGVALIYGRFGSSRPLLNGPFVNSNHNAEFLELATFANIACALAFGTRFQKILWTAGAVFCAAGALATLSRGSILALVAGGGSLGLALLVRRPEPVPNDPGSQGFERRHLVWLVAGVASLSLLALSLGASALLDRLTQGNVLGDIRFALWRDSLRLLSAHPFGVGAGAFDRVYPIYRTMSTGHAVRFSHVENQPLQWLLEYGWVGFVVLVVAACLTLRAFAPRSMTPSSLALGAGLLATFTHNFVDFGLDLLGVSLPFWALAGTLAGRAQRAPNAPAPRSTLVMSLTAVALGFLSTPIIVSRPLRDFDAAIRKAKTDDERRQLAEAAARSHPVDYFYPLVQAWATPLRSDLSGHFPRLRELNRALLLCPHCPDVHLEVARTLWRLGHRKQSVAEYRHAVASQPDLVGLVFDEIWRSGRSTTDLRDFAGSDPSVLLEIGTYLLDHGEFRAASAIVSEAEVAGATAGQLAILRGRVALLQGDSPGAERYLSTALGLLPTDSRIAVLLAEAMERNGKTDQALEVLEAALGRAPNDVDSARLRLSLLARHKRWSQTEKALDGFKEALQNAQVATVEAHVLAARIYVEQGRTAEALAEFQIASVQWPENIELIMEYAQLADRAGKTNRALDLLASVEMMAPGHAGARALRGQIAARRRESSERALLGTELPITGLH